VEAAEDLAMIDPRPTVDGCTTIPALFWRRVEEWGDRVALREKNFGIWQPITWAEYGERARAAGLGLVALGLQPGDVVSILAENIPEWLYADLGILGAGGVSNGIYPSDSATQVDYLLNDSRSRFLVVENEEQLDKALEVRARCPGLQRIIVEDMEGLREFQDPMVMSFSELLELGRARHLAYPAEWMERLQRPRSEDLAILIYTSGTTGASKGAMLSHGNVLFMMSAINEVLPAGPDDRGLSFLPLCHIAERTFTTTLPLKTGLVVHFAEAPDTVSQNLREVEPTVFFAVPRLWEKFYSSITIRMRNATWFGNWAYHAALAVGRRVAECRLASRRPGFGLAAAFGVADLLVLGNVKRMLGLSKGRILFSGAAPISPDLIRWFLALGLDMREGYGQTECSCITSVHPAGGTRTGTVGLPIPGTEIRISSEGEILIRGPHVFLGYLNQPERTAETVVDGWLHTGDVGAIDADGHLRITDRLRDIIITAGGKNITPSEIENQLKFSPYISDAVVIGDGRKYLTCLVMLDHETVAQYAQDRQIPFSNFASLCQAQPVVDLIGQEIELVNQQFARVETIRKFRLIDQLLTAEDEELTPTMKLKRKTVHRKYQGLIDEMYAD
jgi:long-chain acyl-CoA synthetase